MKPNLFDDQKLVWGPNMSKPKSCCCFTTWYPYVLSGRMDQQYFRFPLYHLIRPLTLYLHIYPSIHLSIYPSIHLSIYPSIHLSIDLSIYPSIHLPIYLSTYLPIYLSTYLSIYTKIKWPNMNIQRIHVYICIYIYVYIYMYIYTYIYTRIYVYKYTVLWYAFMGYQTPQQPKKHVLPPRWAPSRSWRPARMPRRRRSAWNCIEAPGNDENYGSMDWFKGKSTGKPHI